MARDLLTNLNAAMFGHRRSPAFKIYIYDVGSTTDTINDVVADNTLEALTGPRDFSEDCIRVSLTETAGDYIESGISAGEITVDISDPHNTFDPYNAVVLSTSDGRWLREGNVVRILEGDEQVDEDEWVWTFTGEIVGQAGVDRGRVGNRGRITFKAMGREESFINKLNTTEVYIDSMTYLAIAEDVANTDMGLQLAEIDFPTIGTEITHHTTTQFVEESPLVTLAHLFFADLFMPRFDGEGKLTASSGIVTQPPVRIYEDEYASVIRSIVRPYHNRKRVNAVRVIGLDAELSKAMSPRQELATLDLTTGYFTDNERVPVYWSEDHTLLAENVSMRILSSVNSGLKLGGYEVFEARPAPNADQEGYVGGWCIIDTGFAGGLISILQGVAILLAIIPDLVTAFGAGFTIPFGRVIQAVAMSAATVIMSMIGRGAYQFIGDPFQYVFKEIRAEARQTGVTAITRNGAEIKNHLITNQTLADSIARDLLFRRAAMSAPRSFTILTDLRLEPDDVFEYQSRRYLIASISRTLSRPSSGISQVECYEVSTGVYA